MKTALVQLWYCLLLAIGPSVRGAELAWMTNLAKAQAQARTEKKSVLLFFHGSDWCPNCAEMQHQVLESPEFSAYARQSLVLVDVDFPEKAKQDEALKAANLALKAKFNVGDNYPTLVLLNESGDTVFQETGYSGDRAQVIASLQRHAKPASGVQADGFKDLSVAEFAEMVRNKENVILDVRTAKEFAAGHIHGAVNLDLQSADFSSKAAALDKSKTYLVHCATGVRSARACKQLAQLDFPSLYNLSGGFKAWQQAGEPVEK